MNKYFTEEFENLCSREFYHLPNYEEYANGDFETIFREYKENFNNDEQPSLEDFIDYVIA